MMNNDRKIIISTGASRRAIQWQAETLTLSELYARLQTPARGTETLAVYMGWPKARQDDAKDNGGFVAGALVGTRRKGDAVAGRDVLTLDLDHIPPGGTGDVLRRVAGLGCGYCVYSTRKHAPEGPRLRVLIPLDRTVTADEYEPIARRMAEYIGIEMADPTTFEPSRLMYWPSCCADSEYIYVPFDGPMVSADGILATFADWRDVTSWPQVPGAATPAKLAAKQEDPESKSGLVGAFCRTYDIFKALDTFLPRVYEPVDGGTDRYTYTGGSTTGGAVIYDGGKFLFSHHATDPVGGRSVNAFDLVRLHKFGAQDDEADPKTPTNRLPSYTAMRDMAARDNDVKALLLKERWEDAGAAFGSPAATKEPEEDPNWRRLLTVNSQGTPEKSMQNLQVILEHDPRLKGKLRLNLFSGRIDVAGNLPWARPRTSTVWNDDDAAQLRIFLEPLCGKCAKTDVLDAVAACASNQAYNPVKDYLTVLQWDGYPRLDRLFIDYLGAVDSPYTRAVTRKSFVAAVARIMRPGCKYDTMPVLVGAQGRHKSTILAKMGGAWFNDSLRTFEGKEAMESIQGTWLNEIAEMHAMNRSDVNAAKAFLTKTSDYYRAAYGHYTAERSRQCVFFGTTNSKECLIDTTGGRRFWPVDIDAGPRVKNVFQDLDGERDQLWAEAVMLWRLGETLHLSAELEEQAKVVQEEHRERHAWEGPIAAFLEGPIPSEWSKWDMGQRQMFHAGNAKGDSELIQRQRVCAAEIWCEVLGKAKGDMQQRNTREINGLLERLPGWESVGVRDAGKPYGKQRCFERITATEIQQQS